MRLQHNITIFSGNTQRSMQQEQTEKAEKSAKSMGGKNQTIFAGGFSGGMSLQDRIQKKKEEAQRRALKIVEDAWAGDKKLDDEIKARREKRVELREDNKSALESIQDIARQQEELRKAYGVDMDSQEQQDLERRLQDRREGIIRLYDTEPTEYQSRVLELENMAGEYRARIEANTKKILEDSEIIKGIQRERLKSHTMVDAQAEAGEVMESLTDEIIGMVVEEGKEHLDEEQEKREEQADEIKEKKEEQEEIQEKREEELDKLMEEMPMEQLVDMDSTLEEVKRQIQNVLNEVQLSTEEIKGAKVDASL